jgi:5-formyltetrahydrofolate cyclo-ligase
MNDATEIKRQLRSEAAARRAAQPDPDGASRLIFERLAAMPEYVAASAVMFYADVRTEVRTRWFFASAWNAGKKVIVPFCTAGEIELFELNDLDELSPGTMGVPEPRAELRGLADRRVEPSQLDLIVVPGLAFDLRGGRLGYGQGYYDRFLGRTRPDALRIAVCYECQLFSEVPALPHDSPVDGLITEKAVYGLRDGLRSG